MRRTLNLKREGCDLNLSVSARGTLTAAVFVTLNRQGMVAYTSGRADTARIEQPGDFEYPARPVLWIDEAAFDLMPGEVEQVQALLKGDAVDQAVAA